MTENGRVLRRKQTNARGGGWANPMILPNKTAKPSTTVQTDAVCSAAKVAERPPIPNRSAHATSRRSVNSCPDTPSAISGCVRPLLTSNIRKCIRNIYNIPCVLGHCKSCRCRNPPPWFHLANPPARHHAEKKSQRWRAASGAATAPTEVENHPRLTQTTQRTIELCVAARPLLRRRSLHSAEEKKSIFSMDLL